METPNEIRTPIAARIMETIDRGEVAPTPRWVFIARRAGVWTLGGVTVCVGALALASLLFRIVNVPALFPEYAHPYVAYPVLVEALPFLWVTLLVISGYLTYREVRATEHGYRYRLPMIVLGMVVLGGAGGVLLFSIGSGHHLDRLATRYMPLHTDIEALQAKRWLSPATGRLMGEVVEYDEGRFLLHTPDDALWFIEMGDTVSRAHARNLQVGMRVGVRGMLLDGEAREFRACELRSLEFRGGRPHRMGPLATGSPEGRMMRPLHAPERNASSTRSIGCEAYRASPEH